MGLMHVKLCCAQAAQAGPLIFSFEMREGISPICQISRRQSTTGEQTDGIRVTCFSERFDFFMGWMDGYTM